MQTTTAERRCALEHSSITPSCSYYLGIFGEEKYFSDILIVAFTFSFQSFYMSNLNSVTIEAYYKPLIKYISEHIIFIVLVGISLSS
jgi:hypothetical protein